MEWKNKNDEIARWSAGPVRLVGWASPLRLFLKPDQRRFMMQLMLRCCRGIYDVPGGPG